MNERSRLVFQALADETRLKIIALLQKRELCVSDICARFDMTQPSISHHLDVLKRAGLVQAEKRGREVYYQLDGRTILECCGKQFNLFDIKLVKG